MPSISIIIISWNARKYLEQCLRSIVDTLESYDAEIIVVDNASSDGSPDLVSQQFPSVKLIRNERNLGFAKANNIGIRHSRGEYLFLINSDVVVYANCFNKMIDYIETQPNIGILGPRILGTNGEVQRSCMGFPTLWNSFCRAISLDSLFPHIILFNGYMLNYWAHDSIKEVDVINGCFWLIRRKAIEEVGLLDENFFMYAEDIDWCKRFNDAGWKVVYYPLVETLHYGGASSSNAPIKFYLEMQKANLKYWNKHYSSLSRIIYRCIILLHQSLRVFGYSLYYILVPTKKNTISFKIKRSVASIMLLLNIEVDW